MTTMTPEQVSHKLRIYAETGRMSDRYTEILRKSVIEMANAIDAHLSLDAVVSDDKMVDHIAKLVADRVGNGMREKYIDLAYRIVESFAARHAVVPDERPIHEMKNAPDEPKFDEGIDQVYFFRIGWNAYRKAMLAQRDGG